MKVFPDTNVLLSAFLGSGLCQAWMEHLLESRHTLVIGEPVVREFVRIAKAKFHIPPDKLSFALEVLRRQTLASSVTSTITGIPDPNNMPIIACALAAGSDIFVTGDKALLALREVQGLPILSPRDSWKRLFGEN